MKLGIVGAGAPAAARTFVMGLRGSARAIVRVDRTPERGRRVVADLQHGGVLGPSVPPRAARPPT